MGSMGPPPTTPGSPAQWLSAASSPRHAPPDLHLAHEEYESRQAGNALSRTAGQSVALAGPTGRPRSRHGHLRGEGTSRGREVLDSLNDCPTFDVLGATELGW